MARAAAVTAVLTACGALFGLVRDQTIAHLFGADGATDAFLVAWTVPEVAATLLIEDAMALVLIPAFSLALARRQAGEPTPHAARARGGGAPTPGAHAHTTHTATHPHTDTRTATATRTDTVAHTRLTDRRPAAECQAPDPVRALLAATAPRMCAALALVAVVLALAAPWWVNLLAPGLAHPALAVDCARLTALTILTFGTAGYLSAALRAHRSFVPPAAIYVAYNLAIIGTVLAVGDRWGVRAAALGVAAGSVLMVLVQLPTFARRVVGWAPGARRLPCAPCGSPRAGRWRLRRRSRNRRPLPGRLARSGEAAVPGGGRASSAAGGARTGEGPAGDSASATGLRGLAGDSAPATGLRDPVGASAASAPTAVSHDTTSAAGSHGTTPVAGARGTTSTDRPGRGAPRRRRGGGPVVAAVPLGWALLAPVALFTLARQAQVLVERFVASALSPGAISHLNYAQKVAQVPMVLSLMICTVTFPLVARAMADGERERARRRVERDLSLAALVVLLGAGYVVGYAPQLVELLFQRGAFNAADTSVTASVMRVYALGLLGHSLTGALVRPFFSAGRPTWYPALAMLGGLVLTMVVGAATVGHWGVYGIALANALGISMTAALLLYGLSSRMLPLDVRRMVGGLGRLALAAALAGAAGALAGRLVCAPLPAAALGALLVPAVFAGAASALRAPEVPRLIAAAGTATRRATRRLVPGLPGHTPRRRQPCPDRRAAARAVRAEPPTRQRARYTRPSPHPSDARPTPRSVRDDTPEPPRRRDHHGH